MEGYLKKLPVRDFEKSAVVLPGSLLPVSYEHGYGNEPFSEGQCYLLIIVRHQCSYK